ncbi:MAG: prepilin-type N-terminal cleavage/methylation domain-containing protein [Deltaproteobacteria bacterium]|nr:MAG: prepilin-type N-terminal cleavage/methylation domain-containing protein [Deltaproteobacteria bacterium]
MTGRSQRGFTVLELLIAMGIVAMMMFIAWSVTAQIAGDKKMVARVADRNRELRVSMARMVRDLSMAYLSQNEATDALEPRTAFIGKGRRDALLRFSSFAHQVLWANAHESEQTMISYFLAPDPRDRNQTNLLRRESRRLSDEGWDQVPHDVDLLVRDVEEVEFEYWDWRENEWRREWDTTAADGQRGRLPTRVRIKITVKGRDGKPVVYTTQARLMMQERLQFFAN